MNYIGDFTYQIYLIEGSVTAIVIFSGGSCAAIWNVLGAMDAAFEGHSMAGIKGSQVRDASQEDDTRRLIHDLKAGYYAGIAVAIVFSFLLYLRGASNNVCSLCFPICVGIGMIRFYRYNLWFRTNRVHSKLRLTGP